MFPVKRVFSERLPLLREQDQMSLLTANIVIDFTTAVVKESIRPKQKNNISIISSAFITKKGASRSHLRGATSAPQTSLFCDLWHPLPAQPMKASFAHTCPTVCPPHLLPMAFLLVLMCKTPPYTHTHTHICVLVWKSKSISTQWEVYDQKET